MYGAATARESVLSPLTGPAHIARSAASGRNVALERVIHNHAIGVEPPAQGPDRPLHTFDPSARQAVAIALIVERNDFIAQDTVERIPIAPVVNIHIGVRPAGPDREAIRSVVGFGPPAVEHRKVQAAVEDHFLAAGSGSLERPPGIVQPDIDALHQMA